ncbi:sporulation protein [Nocardia farcinica]|uniref:Sporulation protein YtfJ (Spore_YtfJ) n=2 Tax=Nocardia farcinica TaxID=37329 RepID=Q5YY22_NOCFA|nr:MULTISPECIES: sporulation protein [Nocardia]AXK85361.1 sporulation protein [Nocardia farcinica]MBA4857653.1 sporulation protein [Nocardia farcinica]MBC9817858.1 sporulation protein [Nocardia farcinica]MBF6140060.1 sporulation protein [Nocardia farcinica]MBF6184859.1 sporulation protein [Nocardia farcinica]
MKVEDILAAAKDTMTVRRVYAEPVERDGTIVIAAAVVSGGGGAGAGVKDGEEGSGGGFGLNAKPAGAYVIRDGRVSWRPAVDVNRLIAVAGAVVITGMLVGARIATAAVRQG